MHHGAGLVDSGFLAMARKPFEVDGKILSPFYGHAFWLGEVDGIKFQYFNGMKGQYIVVIPDYHLVVVRTGHGTVKPADGGRVYDCVKTYVREAVKGFGHY